MRINRVYVVLSVLLLLISSLFLPSLPGLMGDEASEGENVYQLLNGESLITVTGERSYIGPLIDYARIPFILTFGYTTLALRLPMLLISLITFLLAIPTFRRLFGEEATPLALAFCFFNPIYLTYQRLGWAITLLPFFAVLTVYFLTSKYRYKWLWTGLAAGLGLHTHILFLPTLVGIVVGVFAHWGLGFIWSLGFGHWDFSLARKMSEGKEVAKTLAGALMLAFIGFWAGFGTQFAVMRLWTEDQGDAAAQAALAADRVQELGELIPLAISGSPFIARYTGEVLPAGVLNIVAVILIVLVVAAFIRNKTWRGTLAVLIAGGVNLWMMIYLVPQYSPRYLVMFTLAVWLAAGAGAGNVLCWVLERTKTTPGVKHRKMEGFSSGRWVQLSSLIATATGIVFFVVLVVIPFKKTGGSTAEYDLVNYRENAASLVDTRGLIDCVRGIGAVSSENPHVYNRILYASHRYEDIEVLSEEKATSATWMAHYREEGEGASPGEVCSDLRHFKILPR